MASQNEVDGSWAWPHWVHKLEMGMSEWAGVTPGPRQGSTDPKCRCPPREVLVLINALTVSTVFCVVRAETGLQGMWLSPLPTAALVRIHSLSTSVRHSGHLT